MQKDFNPTGNKLYGVVWKDTHGKGLSFSLLQHDYSASFLLRIYLGQT